MGPPQADLQAASLLAQTNAPFEIRPFQLSSADEKLLYALSSYGENRITEFTLYNLFVLTKLAPAESRCAHAATRKSNTATVQL